MSDDWVEVDLKFWYLKCVRFPYSYILPHKGQTMYIRSKNFHIVVYVNLKFEDVNGFWVRIFIHECQRIASARVVPLISSSMGESDRGKRLHTLSDY